MEAMGTIGGGAIVVKKYQAGTTISAAGTPLIGSTIATTDFASVEPMTTSTALTAGNVGIGLDTTGTVAATGITDTNDILVSVAVNPDLIIRCKMSNGGTADTALTLYPTTAADATGVTATGITNLDDSVCWGYDGGNKGEYRCMNDAAGSTAINFPNAIGSGDNFLYASGFPCKTLAAASPWPDLTSSLTQMDATSATNDADNFHLFDLELGTIDNDGANNSFYILIQNYHVFGSTGSSA
jgi:hypothetical protein